MEWRKNHGIVSETGFTGFKSAAPTAGVGHFHHGSAAGLGVNTNVLHRLAKKSFVKDRGTRFPVTPGDPWRAIF
jgi:hypothetical protein